MYQVRGSTRLVLFLHDDYKILHLHCFCCCDNTKNYNRKDMFDDYDYHKKMIDHFLVICNNYNNIKVVMSLMLAIFFCFFCYVVMFTSWEHKSMCN